MKREQVVRRCLLAGSLIAACPAGAFAATEGDWPCIQRKVGEVTAGQMWAGPALDERARAWRDDPAVAALARTLVARRTTLEDAATKIGEFAKAAGPSKDAKLTALFAGVLELINAERARLIAGIERYARNQKALADRIKETADALQGPGGGPQPRKAELEQKLHWDSRIYDDRNQALTYVCESPLILEQRAFALARDIQNHLE
jgi:hypothetical protein